ncbi:MAG: PQQ-binding-like beta-propeller repeat protein [Bacteroidota bacterium]
MKEIIYILLLGSLTLLLACQTAKPDRWEMAMPVIGSNSSPKASDLNQDGVLDIVVGAGRNEFQAAKYGVLAIDGRSGDTLWTYPCIDQVYGSAVFLDISQDGTDDVFMVGRDRQLYALNGKNGELIWKYELQSNEYDKLGLVRFNFYNPVLVDDYSDDGIQDLLIVNGGNVRAAPGDSLNRYPGTMMIMDAAAGNILAIDTMPDGRETYLTPTYYDFDQDGTKEILFGTGGETVTGGFYVTNEKALLNNDIRAARKLMEIPNSHGFIAPPVLADLNQDGIKDVIVLDHGGIISAFDGQNFQQLWTLTLEDVELNAQPSVGNYNGDAIPDIFVNGAKGKWPKNTGSEQFFIDGKDGRILASYNVGCAGFASSVSVDIDGDQVEEVLLPVNDYNCRQNNTLYTTTWLHLFEVDTAYQVMPTLIAGKNISSTPLITDLDADNQMDLVYIVNENVRLIYEFLGLRVKRLELAIPPSKEKHWNQYLGPESNNVL